MTALDWLLLLVLGISVAQGLRHGLLREVFALAGWVAGWILACRFSPLLTPFCLRVTHAYYLAEIFSFLVVLLATMLIAHLAARVLAGGVRTIGLGWLDRLGGALFGLVRGILFVAFGFLIIALFFPNSDWVRHSRLAPAGINAAHRLAAAMPAQLAQRVRSGTQFLHLGVQGWQ